MLTKEAENKHEAHGEYCNPNFLSQSAPIYSPTMGKAQPVHAHTSGLVYLIFSVGISVCVCRVILKLIGETGVLSLSNASLSELKIQIEYI